MNVRQTQEAAARRERIAEVIARQGGASTSDVCEAVGCVASVVCEHLQTLRGEGRAHTGVVFIGRAGGKTTRHFGTDAELAAWLATMPAQVDARRRGELRRDLLPLLQRPEGCTAREAAPIIKCTSDDACCRMLKMQRRGDVFGVDIKGQARRYFDTPEAAAEYRRTAVPTVKAEPVQRLSVLPHKERATAGHNATHLQNDATVTIKARKVGAMAPGEGIVTDRTRYVSDCGWKPTARWQLIPEAPDERWPSFAATRPGMDPLTGAAWGEKARAA